MGKVRDIYDTSVRHEDDQLSLAIIGGDVLYTATSEEMKELSSLCPTTNLLGHGHCPLHKRLYEIYEQHLSETTFARLAPVCFKRKNQV